MKAFIPILLAAGLVWLANACTPAKPGGRSTIAASASKDSLVKRGAYLVSTMGCNDCHSPKKMTPMGPVVDSSCMLSGFPSNAPVPVPGPNDIKNGLVVFNADLTACNGPWGTTFSANITSDASGIGGWKLEQFKNALRHGKYKGLDAERMIMPPMPWENYKNLDDRDMEAIFDYLQSTKPVNNIVPTFRPAGKG